MATRSPVSLQEFLRDANFPVARDDLVRMGRDMGLTPEMQRLLERLPEQTYMTPVDVSLAVAELDPDATADEGRATKSRGGAATRRSSSKAETSKAEGSRAATDQSKPREKRPPQPVMAPSARTEMTGATTRLASRLTGIAKEQLEARKGQATMQLDQAAHSIRQSSEQFREQGNPTLADVSEAAASGLEQANEFLRTRDIDGVIREAEAAARRQPA